MSYQIEYFGVNQLEQKYNSKFRRRKQILVMVIICVILLAVSVYVVGVDRVKEVLVPGNNQVTISAFNEMQKNLKNGMSAKDAITVFCSEILQSANVQ